MMKVKRLPNRKGADGVMKMQVVTVHLEYLGPLGDEEDDIGEAIAMDVAGAIIRELGDDYTEIKCVAGIGYTGEYAKQV